jgi:hypothetical protein
VSKETSLQRVWQFSWSFISALQQLKLMNETPVAGISFPWENIAGAFLRLKSFHPQLNVPVESVRPIMGFYSLATAELPNPDVDLSQRVVQLPIKHKSDYKSLYCAHLDAGVKAGTNELVILYEPRKGFFGGRKPSWHVACYPAGTWQSFFDAVANYSSDKFLWPKALFLYQPGETRVFPASNNLFVA